MRVLHKKWTIQFSSLVIAIKQDFCSGKKISNLVFKIMQFFENLCSISICPSCYPIHLLFLIWALCKELISTVFNNRYFILRHKEFFYTIISLLIDFFLLNTHPCLACVQYILRSHKKYVYILYTALTNQTIKKVGIEVFFDPESVLLVLALWCNRGNRSVDSSKKRFLFQRNGDPNPQTQIDPEVQTQKRQQWNKLVFLNLLGKTYPPTVS